MPSFFFNHTATTEISPLPLPAALPIFTRQAEDALSEDVALDVLGAAADAARPLRSEEHTSELQSPLQLVCPLFFLIIRRPPRSPLFPSPPLFRSSRGRPRTRSPRMLRWMFSVPPPMRLDH